MTGSERRRNLRAVILGCGGIAYYLAEHVARQIFIANKDGDEAKLYLIDGDLIESKNLERQYFQGVVGWNKAEALGDMVHGKHPTNHIETITQFINRKTLKLHKGTWLSTDPDDLLVIFLCVDNNKTREYVSDQVKRFRDVIIVDGGNDEFAGQARLHIRSGGKDILPRLTQISPEIRHSGEDDIMPSDEHCLDDLPSQPQTAMINSMVANAMNVLFTREVWPWIHQARKIKTNEIRIDTQNGAHIMTSFKREAVPGSN